MKVLNIKCPHCGTEYEVEQKEMYRYTKCEVCGKGFVIGQSLSSEMMRNETQRTSAIVGNVTVSKTPQSDHSQLRPLGGNDVMTRYQKALSTVRKRLKALDGQLKICEQRNAFFEQLSIFECDWDAHNDETLPKRLQFIVDGLRARVANAHSSIVANEVAHAASSNMAFGTTVGLRNPNSGLYLIARDIAQEGGWSGMVAAVKQRELLNGSIEVMTTSLSHYESLMLYYYDLCEEFRGKDKETARRDRLRARCGCPDENSLPLIEEGKTQTMLLKEQEVLENKKRRLELWLHHEAQSRIGRVVSESWGSSVSMCLTCVIVAIIVFLIIVVIAASK